MATFSICVIFIISIVSYRNAAGVILDPNAEDIPQDKCINSKAITHDVTEWFQEFAPKYFYVPMGNRHLYRSIAKELLGRPADTGKDDVKNFNLKIQFLPSFTISTEGFNGSCYMKQQCLPEKSANEVNCSPLPFSCLHSENVDMNLIPTSYDTIVWENSDVGAIIITRCVNNTVADWRVLSKFSTLPEKIQATIHAEVKLLGLTDDNPTNTLS